jgi:hypothetical protein
LGRFISGLYLSFSSILLIVWVMNIYGGQLLKFYYLISDCLSQ